MDTESIQSDVPRFYYTERDVERWRHKTLFVMKSEMLLKHQTTTNPDFNFQFSLSHYTNSIVNPLLAQINETLRQTVASCTNIPGGGGGGGGGLWYFHTYVGSDHFWGFKIF